jgi:hypothetical protein
LKTIKVRQAQFEEMDGRRRGLDRELQDLLKQVVAQRRAIAAAVERREVVAEKLEKVRVNSKFLPEIPKDQVITQRSIKPMRDL